MRSSAKNPFDTAHLESDLKGHTVRGGVTTLAAQEVGFVQNVLSVVVLARILGLCVATAAPAIVWLENEPRLLPIALAVADVFVVDGSAIQNQALLRR